MTRPSAVVVGSGPNGLAAAITLAKNGCDVTVLEAASTIGGGSRTAELTLPGFKHDVCSAIHPLAVASPFFRSVPLDRFGLQWIHPPLPLAHVLDEEGSAAVLERSVVATAAGLGSDQRAYHDLFAPLVERCDDILDELLGPIRLPRHPLPIMRFALSAIRPATSLARQRFEGEAARALFAGMAAHSVLSLDAPGSASFGIVLGMLGHAWGWPMPRGGSQMIVDAMAAYLKSLGGSVVTGERVASWKTIPPARIVMFDVGPKQLASIGGDRLPANYRGRLQSYRYGPGAFKVDWALAEPIPWRNTRCRTAGTVHVGGRLGEVAQSERNATGGVTSERPFLLVAQPSCFDDTRAPAGAHTAWAYCHVPNGSAVDMTERIERQVERFAPGFRDLVRARHVMGPADLEAYNANYVGGDIVGGANDLLQLLARPMLRWDPYSTPVSGWYICSASTAPGGGVHGMSGFHAARSALRWLDRGGGRS